MPEAWLQFCCNGEGECGCALWDCERSRNFDARCEHANELVGRDADMVHLQKLAHVAASGQRQLVFITGEAGIGKTSLINALREVLGVTSPQACMACGHCVEGLSEKEDYYPVLEALGQCFSSTDREDGLAADLRGDAPFKIGRQNYARHSKSLHERRFFVPCN